MSSKNGGTNIVRTGVTLLLPPLIEKGIIFFIDILRSFAGLTLFFFKIHLLQSEWFLSVLGHWVKGQGQLSSVKGINCLHIILRTPCLTDIKLGKSNLLLESPINFEFTRSKVKVKVKLGALDTDVNVFTTET